MTVVDDHLHRLLLPQYYSRVANRYVAEFKAQGVKGFSSDHELLMHIYDCVTDLIMNRVVDITYASTPIMNTSKPMLKVRMDGSVSSGVAVMTTLGNTLRMCMMNMYIMSRYKINLRFCVMGDDIIYAGKK